jgi:hypothetical protein
MGEIMVWSGVFVCARVWYHSGFILLWHRYNVIFKLLKGLLQVHSYWCSSGRLMVGGNSWAVLEWVGLVVRCCIPHLWLGVAFSKCSTGSGIPGLFLLLWCYLPLLLMVLVGGPRRFHFCEGTSECVLFMLLSAVLGVGFSVCEICGGVILIVVFFVWFSYCLYWLCSSFFFVVLIVFFVFVVLVVFFVFFILVVFFVLIVFFVFFMASCFYISGCSCQS